MDKMYSYDIIEPNYRDMIAIGMISSYFKSGRTMSLSFDPSTGDQGAYNIYENERRQDIIITKIDTVIDKLDQIQANQMVIADGIRRTNKYISDMERSINNQLSFTNERLMEIQGNAEVIEYNTRCANYELSCLKWMEILG